MTDMFSILQVIMVPHWFVIMMGWPPFPAFSNGDRETFGRKIVPELASQPSTPMSTICATGLQMLWQTFHLRKKLKNTIKEIEGCKSSGPKLPRLRFFQIKTTRPGLANLQTKKARSEEIYHLKGPEKITVTVLAKDDPFSILLRPQVSRK